MVCGGFACSKNALVTLNCLYIVVSFILIGVGAYAKAAAVIVNLSIVGGVIGCGILLLLISLAGLIGACKHHQVLLFFYMIVLFLLFLVQFSLGVVCLAVNKDQEIDLVRKAWQSSHNSTRDSLQIQLDCCGFEDWKLNSSAPLGHPSCSKLPCCTGAGDGCCVGDTCPCKTCFEKLNPNIHKAFSWSGGLGLFFSFSEIIGVWVTVRYRNQKDPRANPSSFL
ncbi:tetraspanin-31-like isoform X2 [Dreissena polymorpha]|uniref:tetraspanin-31-like isoform X2 n=1 Tax=Dreissena polymorpha TaxID=45954 RepID=UPI0022642BA4|nr:tetraspanin-31-like isoform X2 [Dreissena polymorpha]XP_052265258.1 tetraspanin-31-like isoform X2 [Dreissena polymorpha]